MEKSYGSLKVLYDDLKRRLRTPLLSTSFYTHLLVVVVIGAIGIWFPLLQGDLAMANIAMTVITFFPPLVAVAFLEFIEEDQLYLRNFGLSAALILALVFLISVTRTDPYTKYDWACAGTALSIFLWWLANGENPRFKDFEPYDALAGNPKKPLHGTTPKGWKTK